MKNARPRLFRALKGAMMRYVPLMITCREFDAFIHDYISESLTAGQRRRFLFHLRLCRECREYLVTYEQTIALGKAASADKDMVLHAEAPESLIRAILDARQN